MCARMRMHTTPEEATARFACLGRARAFKFTQLRARPAGTACREQELPVVAL